MLRQHLVSEINTVLNDNKKGIGIVELLPDLLQVAKYGRVGQNAPINRKRKGTCPSGFLCYGVYKINIGHLQWVLCNDVSEMADGNFGARYVFIRIYTSLTYTFDTINYLVILEIFVIKQ